MKGVGYMVNMLIIYVARTTFSNLYPAADIYKAGRWGMGCKPEGKRKCCTGRHSRASGTCTCRIGTSNQRGRSLVKPW